MGAPSWQFTDIWGAGILNVVIHNLTEIKVAAPQSVAMATAIGVESLAFLRCFAFFMVNVSR